MPSPARSWSILTLQQRTARAPTLNAIAQTLEAADDRIARQLRGCRELFELGMDVARAAAREAVANLNTPIEHPIPGAHLPPVCRTTDPGRLFTRAAYAVRQAIALENRIVAGDFGPLQQHPEPRSPSPPRTPGPADTRSGLQAETPESLHAESLHLESLESDNRPAGDILAAIRQALGLVPNPPLPDTQPPATPTPRTGKPAPPGAEPAPRHPRPLNRHPPTPPRPG